MSARSTFLAVLPLCGRIHGKWLLCLGVSILALAATCWPDGAVSLRYDRSALMDGEIWRVMTAHLTHLGLPHLLLNLLGLALICELLWGELPLRHGIGLLGFSAAATSAALWWLHPELIWYAGLSGVLHGLWAGCALSGLRLASPRLRLTCLAGVLLLAAKLLMEFYYGPSAGTARLIGGEVVSTAHLYGALAGAVYVAARGCVRMRLPFRGALQQQ